MGRISERLRRLFEREPKGGTNRMSNTEGITPPLLLGALDWKSLDSRGVDSSVLQIKPFDEKQELAEHTDLGNRLSLAAQKLKAPVGASKQDYQRWITLQNTFWEGIEPIHAIQRQKLAEVDQVGAKSWLEVSIDHIIDMGCELIARRNIQQQLGLARKYNVEDRVGSFLHLLEFYQGLMTSIRIRDLTLTDFLNPQEKSLVGRYRFLAQASLVVYRNLYDEILQDNQDPLKNAYPNIIRRAMWTFPSTIEALLINNPDTLEQVYKNSEHPLNEIGLTASKLSRGVQTTRIEALKLILNPRFERFQALKQVVEEYLSSGDRQVVLLALNLLGLHTVAGIRQLYRQSRRYANQNIEVEFFSLIRETVKDYAKEASLTMHIPDEDDMDLIADLDDIVGRDKVPSFEDLGKIVSAIFQKSSQTSYTVNPTDVELSISFPQSITVQFDPNRPRKFDAVLTYVTEDGEELTEVDFGLDIQKNTLEWNYLADPSFPENARVSNFRSLLLMTTRSILENIQKQAKDQYDARISKRAVSTVQQSSKVKRERYQDPIYQLRKEVRAEQRQMQTDKTLETSVSTGGIIGASRVKNEVVVPTDIEQARLLRALSPEDRQIITKTLDQFNQTGTGGELTKKIKLGPDGRERWSLRIACSVPKGARVLLAPVEFSSGLRKFEIIDIRYRKDIYPKNKI